MAPAAARARLRRGDSKASAKTPPMKVSRKGSAQSQGVDRAAGRDQRDDGQKAEQRSRVAEVAGATQGEVEEGGGRRRPR